MMAGKMPILISVTHTRTDKHPSLLIESSYQMESKQPNNQTASPSKETLSQIKRGRTFIVAVPGY